MHQKCEYQHFLFLRKLVVSEIELLGQVISGGAVWNVRMRLAFTPPTASAAATHGQPFKYSCQTQQSCSSFTMQTAASKAKSITLSPKYFAERVARRAILHTLLLNWEWKRTLKSYVNAEMIGKLSLYTKMNLQRYKVSRSFQSTHHAWFNKLKTDSRQFAQTKNCQNANLQSPLLKNYSNRKLPGESILSISRGCQITASLAPFDCHSNAWGTLRGHLRPNHPLFLEFCWWAYLLHEWCVCQV